MKRYIKTNAKNQIIKIFIWQNRPEFDGSEIEFDENGFSNKINNKDILNEYGTPVFIFDGTVIERSQSEIDNDIDFIDYYKKLKKDELNKYIGDNLLDIIKPGTRELSDIVSQWDVFKQNANNWTTKQQIDNAYNQAITWLHS